MKKKLFILGLALASTFALASCGDETQSGNDKTDVVDNGENNQGENNQGENNQGENNQGENNQGGEEVHEHEYLLHKAIAPTYTRNGQYAYYSCIGCSKLFDENKKEIASLDDVKRPALAFETEVASIDADGVLHLSVTPEAFQDVYEGKFTLQVTVGNKTYDAPTVKWAEEVQEDAAYIVCEDDVTVGLRNKSLSEATSASVGDKVSFVFTKKGYTSEIRFFNITGRQYVDCYGKDIEITFNDEKKAEFEALKEQIKAEIAKATVTEEHPDTSEALPYDDVDALYQKFIDGYHYCIDQYRYASIIADSTAEEEDYTRESAILAFAQNFEVWDQEIDLAMAKSIYRNDFFEGMSEDEINDYIAGLDPETTAEGNKYQEAMDNALAEYKSGTTPAFQALTTYVQNATEYAKLQGYTSYIDYAYENVYGREYTPSETNSLVENIAEYIVPVYEYTQNKFNTFQASSSTNKDWNIFVNLYYAFFGGYFDQLESYAKQIGGDYEKNFKQYFVDGDYFYSGNTENKNVTGYVGTYANGHPLMFLGANYQGINTFIHEFGHYNAKCTKGDFGSYDLAETQSQGNEMLFYTYFANQGAVKKSVVEQYSNFMIYNMCNSILVGYLYNEVEKYLYTTDLTTLTENKLSNKWNDVCAASGLDALKNGFDISILLNYNCYYISYSTSAIAALEVYAKGLQNWEEAINSYTVIYQQHADDATFTSVLVDSGLYSVFDEEAYKLIATAFSSAYAN